MCIIIMCRDREQDELSGSRDQLLSEHLAEVSRREAERLRECLEEAQRALTEGSMGDESIRAQIEEQLGLYRRLVSEQERRLLDHMRQTGTEPGLSTSARTTTSTTTTSSSSTTEERQGERAGEEGGGEESGGRDRTNYDMESGGTGHTDDTDDDERM